MNFKDYLNQVYILLDCTQSELSNESGLSAPVISRYLSGDREPAINSDQLKALAQGLSSIATKRNISDPSLSYDNILSEFNNSINQINKIKFSFAVRFNSLIKCFDISIRELANFTNFDISYMYRVRSGERYPVDLNKFCLLIADYICEKYTSQEDRNNISGLLNCSSKVLTDTSLYHKKIIEYLTNPIIEDDLPSMDGFLHKMDEFDLNEYIKIIHFDELKVPTVPFQLPASKYYYGVDNMRQAELNFFKATVLGKSMDSVFMCSHMPMLDLAEDMDFNKKWMFGIAMSIKKGLHLNVVHNLNRPMEELMLGFEAWIPIYMTGQVSPYYLPNFENKVFNQINYCSGSAALYGECIDDHFADGRYYVTNNKSEINYYRTKADNIMSHAKPLMDIYTVDNQHKYVSFLEKNMLTNGNRRIIDRSLPLCAMPEELLDKLISDLEESIQTSIKAYYKQTCKYTANILKSNTITYDIANISKEAYESTPMTLCFPDLFNDVAIDLNYDEYLLFLDSTKQFAVHNSNFIINYVDEYPFINIKIAVVSKKYFIISKCKCPNIHFVIHHSKMLEAMEHFYIARKES